ncbi:Nuclear factor NF-kappa-B p100 subunit [Chamberlinius hualienensis]
MSPTHETSVHSTYVVEFVEQPSREFRFRYLSEFKKGSHGCLKSDRSKKSKEGGGPIIRTNYKESMKLEIGLYTATEPKREHVHKLVEGSKTEASNGKLNILYGQSDSKGEWIYWELKNMNILHMGKDEVDKFLKDWYLKEKNMSSDTYDALTSRRRKTIEDELKERKRDIENNVVLGIQVYDAHDPNKLICGPCYSDKISNTKTVKKLNIEDISKVSGSCSGGDEVFILCDKLRLEDIDKMDPEKSDIAIEFYENSGNQPWTATAKIKKIHHQTAIIFVTPAYKDVNLKEPLDVSMRLIRKSDKDCSDSRRFTYEPVHDDYELRRKRKKTFHTGGNQSDESNNNNSSNNINSFDHRADIGQAEIQAADVLLGLSRTTPGDLEHDIPAMEDEHVLDEDLDPKLSMEHLPELNVDEIEVEAPAGLVACPNPLYKYTDPMFGGIEKDENQSWDIDSAAKISDSMVRLHLGDPVEEKQLYPPTKSRTTQTAEPTYLKDVNTPDNLLILKLALHTAQCLHNYAKTGNVSNLLMSMRYLIALPDENGDNAIHASVLNSQVHVLSNLLEMARTIADNDVLNMCNGFHQSPLHIAVQKKSDSMVSLLLHHGANPNYLDRKGNTAVHLAAQQDKDNCLNSILNTYKYTVKYSKHAPKLDSYNYAGFTPLHLAVLNNSCVNVARLCYVGCDVNLCDRTSGRSALHMAIEKQNLEIVLFLLQNMKADTDVGMFNGDTPLHLAVRQDNLKLVRLLMEASADPYLETRDVYIPNDEEADSSDSDNEVERCGVSPWDLARSVEVRCCLKGEVYEPLLVYEVSKEKTPIVQKRDEVEVAAVTRKETKIPAEPLDSGIGLSAMSCNSSFSVDGGGDSEVSKTLADLLDVSAMKKLCETLNGSRKWRQVLQLTDNLELIDVIKDEDNPTEAMFQSLLAEDGSKVSCCLQAIDLPVEKRIIEEAMSNWRK